MKCDQVFFILLPLLHNKEVSQLRLSSKPANRWCSEWHPDQVADVDKPESPRPLIPSECWLIWPATMVRTTDKILIPKVWTIFTLGSRPKNIFSGCCSPSSLSSSWAAWLWDWSSTIRGAQMSPLRSQSRSQSLGLRSGWNEKETNKTLSLNIVPGDGREVTRTPGAN